MSLRITRHTGLKRGVCGHSLLAHPPTGCAGGGGPLPDPLVLLDFANGIYKSHGAVVSDLSTLFDQTPTIQGGRLVIDASQTTSEIHGDLLDALTDADGFTIVFTLDVEPHNGQVSRIIYIDQQSSGAKMFIDQGGVSPIQAAYHGMRVQSNDGSYAEIYPSSPSSQLVKQAWSFSSDGVAASMAGTAVVAGHNAQSITGAFTHAFFGSTNSFSSPAENNYDGYSLTYLAVYPIQPESNLPRLSV